MDMENFGNFVTLLGKKPRAYTLTKNVIGMPKISKIILI